MVAVSKTGPYALPHNAPVRSTTRLDRARIAALAALLQETIQESSASVLLGAASIKGAVWADDSGTIHMRYPGVEVTLRETIKKRVLTAINHRWRVATISHLVFSQTAGWQEHFSEMSEYARLQDMMAKNAPTRRHATKLRSDGAVVTLTQRRELDPELDREVLSRTICVTSEDRSRIEEEETLIREGDRERYHLNRAEYDQGLRRTKMLQYRYPPLTRDFYEHIRRRILDFDIAP